jgi:mannosyltransferase
VLATNPPRHAGLLQATECADPRPCLDGVQRLWLVRTGTLSDPVAGVGAAKEQILRQQFRVVTIWQPAGLTLALLQRRPPLAY